MGWSTANNRREQFLTSPYDSPEEVAVMDGGSQKIWREIKPQKAQGATR
jgi:hypothetical protein